MLVGRQAQRQAVTNPLNTFYSVKRLTGNTYAATAAAASQLVYGVCEGADGAAALACPARGCALAPEEVSAELLRILVARARQRLGTPIDGAVRSRAQVPYASASDESNGINKGSLPAGDHRASLL